ncbi:MAG: hypothetical protein WBE26_18585 [Phycisphaerae bacterium]
MIVGVCNLGERRVALIPDVAPGLTKQSLEVLVEQGAGREARITDFAFEEKDANEGEIQHHD